MPSPGAFIFGPWRAVSVLGITQILSWGALFYPPVLTVPLIAADHGWSPAFAMDDFPSDCSSAACAPAMWAARLIASAAMWSCRSAR